MLPPGHIAYTLVSLNEIQKKTGKFKDADYRLVALMSMGPDFIDKPMAFAYFYPKYKSSRLFAHTLVLHLVVLLLTLWKAPDHLVYALTFNGHAIADRQWFHPQTFLWPLLGWGFYTWRSKEAQEGDSLKAYQHDFINRRWLWEIGGMIALLWFIGRNHLWERERLVHLLLTGRLLPLERRVEGVKQG
jgi:hypothetical protein